MNKLVFQGFTTILAVGALWFALYNVDWMHLFKVEKANDSLEEKLGDLYWKLIEESEEVIENDSIFNPVDSLLSKICKANDIDREEVKLHIIKSAEVNAFALPDGHMIVYTGLIAHAENEGELTGVLSHELAHMELKHVMKKLVKEVGLSVLVSMTTGSGGEVITQTLKVLSSGAYDRSLEKEADIKAVDYMVAAGINPKPFADFLYRLSQDDPEFTKYLMWVSTHPDSEERAVYILEYAKEQEGPEPKPVLDTNTWEKLRERARLL